MPFDPLVQLHTQYLKFTEIPQVNGPAKTRSWLVFSERSGALLGRIKWFGRWRQFAFFPEPDTVWNKQCLDDIEKFLEKAFNDWRDRKNKPVDSATSD